MKLAELIKTNPEFTRSINLSEDLGNVEMSNAYVWTKSNGRNLNQIFYELGDKSKNGAFSLIGPFGTGKSAFILEILHLMGAGGTKARNNTIKKIKESGAVSDKLLEEIKPEKIKPFTVIIYGRQEGLKIAILKGIQNALNKANIKAKKSLAYIKEVLNNDSLNTKTLFRLLDEELASEYNQINIVIDEFGKFLEFAALHPSKSDLIYLQEIAELRKSESKCALLLVTILHQAFEGYAKYLSKTSQNEWAKIQGRFQSIHITEDPEELVPLISGAFETIRNNKAVDSLHDKTIDGILKMPFISQFWSKAELITSCKKALPLNPLALFVLPFLSKTAGQNARSTFTFLNSHEPLALPAFLQDTDVNNIYCPQIDLSHLYDYFTHADYQKVNLGGKWNEVSVAIARLQNGNEAELRVLKTIGVLNILQLPQKFSSNLELIAFSLRGSGLSEKDIKKALDSLVDLKIVVYRKFAKEYRIWEGSDFNIEAAVEKRRVAINTNAEIVKKLNGFIYYAPLLAKRHYEETGTLRCFDTKFIESDILFSITPEEDIRKRLFSEGIEGGIGLIVCGNQDEYEEVATTVQKLKLNKNIILIISKPDFYLFDLLKECVALNDILGSEATLLNDSVAQKEVATRVHDAQDRLQQKVLNEYWQFKSDNTVYWANKKADIANKKEFNILLSKAFSKYYSKSPENHNELMNKFKISGSVSSARKCLIRSLLSSKGKETLEIGNVPGTQTLFRLLYDRTGIFAKVGGKFSFKKPKDEAWSLIWDDLTKFFEDRIGIDTAVADVLNYFEAAPYGIRQPVMMMFLIAYLETPNTGLALYDEGTYVPQKDDVLYEILAKRPKHFTLRKFGKTSNEKNILNALYKVMTNEELPDSEEILFDVLKVLYRPIRLLPSFVNQTRQEISETSQQIRNAFLKANKPDELVFKVIPQILGFPENELLSKNNEKTAKAYAFKVKDAIDELSAVINIVTQKCLKIMQKVFNLGGKTPQTLRVDFVKRVGLVEAVASDPRVKNLILKVKNTGLKDDKWAESVLSAITVKPINSWNDFDYTDFENKCIEIYRPFKNYELLATGMFAADAPSTEFSTRFSITSSDGTDINHVVFEKPENKETKKKMADIKASLADLDPAQAQAVLLELLKTYHQSSGVK